MPAPLKPASAYSKASEGDDKTVFNLEQIYLKIGDQYETLLNTLDLSGLDPSASLDRETTLRLALVIAFQYAETLTDQAAAEAVHLRAAWKYALHLALVQPGLGAPALCRFRESLLSSAQAQRVFGVLIRNLKEMGLFPRQKNKAITADEVLNTVCMINRFYNLKRAMKAALSCLVANDPKWLSVNALPHWYQRYKTTQLGEPSFLSISEMTREAGAQGKDIHHLLNAIQAQNLAHLMAQAEILTLARLLEEEFIGAGADFYWRPPNCSACPCSLHH